MFGQIFCKIFLNNILSTALKLFSDFSDATIFDDVDKNSKDEESLPPSTSPEVVELLDTSSDDIKTKVTNIIKICKENGGTSENAVEVLRVAQQVLVPGRDLEIHDATGSPLLRKTNNLLINRNDLIAITSEGIKSIQNLFLTLEVQFYMKVCSYIYIISWFLPTIILKRGYLI